MSNTTPTAKPTYKKTRPFILGILFGILAFSVAGTAVHAGTLSPESSLGNSSTHSTKGALAITSPERTVQNAPHTATLTIHDEDSHDFTIPYIQTSTSLTTSATISETLLPQGGGVRFTLTGKHHSPVSLSDMTAPYSVTFTNLPKDEYTLVAQAVTQFGTSILGKDYTDTATQIGIGDIISAVGDSITECYYGNRTTTPVLNWLDSPKDMMSLDGRNFPQYGPTTKENLGAATWCTPWESQLAQSLEDTYSYPVFIMNEGVGGIRADNTLTRMATAQWSDREHALHPNKMILHLGTNDGNTGVSRAAYKENMQSIISIFEHSYGVAPSNIWVADPSFDTNLVGGGKYIPDLVSLRASNGLKAGPDLWTFFSTNTDTWYGTDQVHPNKAGDSQMARLWALAMVSPQQVSVTNTGNGVQVSWNDLSKTEPSVHGYKVSYGTLATDLLKTIDVGMNTQFTLNQGLKPGITYYFSVQGYDNSPTPQTTDTSSMVSIRYSDVPSTPHQLSALFAILDANRRNNTANNQ